MHISHSCVYHILSRGRMGSPRKFSIYSSVSSFSSSCYFVLGRLHNTSNEQCQWQVIVAATTTAVAVVSSMCSSRIMCWFFAVAVVVIVVEMWLWTVIKMCKNLTINDVDVPACVCVCCMYSMRRIKCTNSFGANHIVQKSILRSNRKAHAQHKQISYEYKRRKCSEGGRRRRRKNHPYQHLPYRAMVVWL